MGEPVSDFVSVQWLKPLWKKLQALHRARDAQIVAIADLFGDPVQLARYYVPPHCQHHNPADHDEDDSARSHVRMPVFDLINGFLNGELQQRDGRSQLFVLSDAGMGKTSLLMMLRLAQLTAFWPTPWQCLLLKLGNDSLERIGAVEHPSRTILLLDALDEDPAAWGRIDARLRELLQATAPFRRVILSCRTQFFPKGELDPLDNVGRVVVDGYRCPMVYLSLFDDSEVDEYLAHRFPQRWYQLPARRRAMQRRQEQARTVLSRIGSLRFRPLLLTHIDDLLNRGEKEWNPYTIYRALVEVWLDREERKLGVLHRGRAPLPTRTDLLRACVRVAEWMHRQGDRGGRTIAEADVQALIRDDPDVAYLEEFDVGGRSLLNRDSSRAFRFSHYSIQEFLLAHGIVTGLIGETAPPLRATDQLVRFLVQAGGRDLRRLELSGPALAEFLRAHPSAGWVLAGMDLAGIDLTGVDLSGADLSGADLSGTKLGGARLDGARLTGTRWGDPLASGGQGPTLVGIPAGRFLMGDRRGDGHSDEQPVHEVAVGAFALGRCPVTVEEFARFTAATDHRTSVEQRGDRQNWRAPGFAQDGDHPVVHVSWRDARAYCRWLSDETGREYRLPTEAEWEYAARAGTEGSWFFGDDAARLGEYAWYDANSGDHTHGVGQKGANPWGLHDLLGNVWEWTASAYEERYAGAETRCVAEDDPSRRVVRGGGWSTHPEILRSADSSWLATGTALNTLGFRLARTL